MTKGSEPFVTLFPAWLEGIPLASPSNEGSTMPYIEFDQARPLDAILLGRIAIDFNPAYSDAVKEEFKPLKDVHHFEKYVGGSPANIAVGLAHHGLRAGFLYGLFSGWSIQDCLEFGSAEASMMVRANNCSDALPTPDEVRAFIAEEKAAFGEMVVRA